MVWAHRILIVITCCFGISLTAARADDSVYLTEVKPLLKARCYSCHGGLKQEAGLRLDTAALIHQGGDSGSPLAAADKIDASLLLQRVSTTDLTQRMPPEHEGEPFTADEIGILTKWIKAGAPGPEHEDPEADPKSHWSFRPIIRRDPPADKSGWSRNPIDAWIASRHQELGLTPQKEASRIELLRRLSIDLIGLPPTDAEIQAFEADRSADWYEKAVDRLLNDPRHGERWARHWMDIWRYSDWWGLGAQVRNSSPHMWHFRDWIVQSLNEDASYAEMLRLMLAADELTPEDPEKLRASGFLVRNYLIFNRGQWLDETVEHVSKGLLGLTMNCAKCHDHKYDPLSQVEYYKFRAFFEPYMVRMDYLPGEPNLQKNGLPRVFDGLLDTPTYLFIRGDETLPDKSQNLAAGVPEILSFDEWSIEQVSLPQTAWQPGLKQWILDDQLARATQRVQDTEAKLVKARDTFELALRKDNDSAQERERSVSIPPINEPFETLDPTRWRVSGESWKHSPAQVKQIQDGQVRSALTYLGEIPADFDATVRFRIQGGSRWRSVGLVFDQAPMSPGGLDGQTVYLSAAAEDSKIQGSYTQGGISHYPSDGRKSLKVELNKDYRMRVQARGQLVNVTLNDELVLVWRSPVERRIGGMQLMTFDALAEFTGFQLMPLDPQIRLKTPSGSLEQSPGDAFELAQVGKEIALADLESVKARIAASIARRDQHDPQAQLSTRRAAIVAERQLAVENGKLNLLSAKQSLAGEDQAKRAEHEKKVAEAEKQLQDAVSLIQTPITDADDFTPFAGAVWTATRFGHTGQDDPNVPFPQVSTGRRTALANWITDQRNPLTARVAVNHIWTRHFGQPLAPLPFDLGRSSTSPASPELIDWMADEFMEHGWSMKHLHRLIVTSAAYRMSSSLAGAEVNIAKDPDNQFLWRRLPSRIESQVVRDSVLTLAGTLDLTQGGPSIPMSEQATSTRRSLYFFHSNNERNRFLDTFDEANVTECYIRDQSIVPQQALALTNSELILEAAPAIAKELSHSDADDTKFVRRGFRVVLGIDPDQKEVDASVQALEKWRTDAAFAKEDPRTLFVWVLLNHNDFVTLR